jgi:glycosyltransferase involved in cell wall biosynthesis
MERKKIVFLYTELATYFLACVEKLSQQPNVEVHIVRWPLNKEAPFNFSFSENIKIYNRNDFQSKNKLADLLNNMNPSVIYCSGWMDKIYLRICKQYKNKIPVILGFDNQWKGSAKQRIACIISPLKILNHFSHCWVPGSLQYEYALRLGFKKENILTGFYCCDFDLFHNQYTVNKEQKQHQFPKRFIYVGRYVEHKGIKDLWQAFIDLQNEDPNDWELWCLGVGDIDPIGHQKIKHFGFVQPNDLAKYIKETGVFVLPSHFEPWGVVVHEFGAAGFPIICSDEVGAKTAFVENNVNGYIYKAGNSIELKKQLKKIMGSTNNELFLMAEKSVDKAKRITPEIWSETLMKLISHF